MSRSGNLSLRRKQTEGAQVKVREMYDIFLQGREYNNTVFIWTQYHGSGIGKNGAWGEHRRHVRKTW